MITLIFIILLIVFLGGFFGLGYFDIQISNTAPPLIASLNQAGISMTQIQIILGIGILFCQFAIILFSMLDPIADTIKAIIKPLVRLVPLIAFLTSIWKTYAPVLFSILPAGVAQAFGVTKVEGYMAQAVSTGAFTTGVLITLGTMVLFVVTTFALGRSQDSAQVKALKAENAKLRRQLRGGL